MRCAGGGLPGEVHHVGDRAVSARREVAQEAVVGRPEPRGPVDRLGPHGHGVLDGYGAGVHQGQQRQPGCGVLRAGLGGAEAGVFGAADGGVVGGEGSVRGDDGVQGEGVAVRRAVGGPALWDRGGEALGQYGDAVRSAVPVAARGAQEIGHRFPWGAGAARAEAVQLLGGAEFGQGRVQGGVVEFGADQQGGAASQHLWIRSGRGWAGEHGRRGVAGRPAVGAGRGWVSLTGAHRVPLRPPSPSPLAARLPALRTTGWATAPAAGLPAARGWVSGSGPVRVLAPPPQQQRPSGCSSRRRVRSTSYSRRVGTGACGWWRRWRSQ